MSNLKQLINLSDQDFEFQFDSTPYLVPARSKKLFLASVADHGAAVSVYQTDPAYDHETGQLINEGGIRVQRCVTEDISDVAPLDRPAQPIVIDQQAPTVAEAANVLKALPQNMGGRRSHPALPKKTVTAPPVSTFVPAKEKTDGGDSL